MQWDVLAGLRFFLAWVVMFCHVSHFTEHRDFLIRFDNFGGHPAVLGFLLISGFSIAHSLSKKTKGFYQRRLLRVYPLYLTSIFISLIPFLLTGQKIKEYASPTIRDFMGNLFFLQGFIVFPLSSNIVVWTLSVEIFCYLLAPFLMKIGSKKLLALIIVSSACYALSSQLHLPIGNSISGFRSGIPLLLLSWAWLLGFFFYFHKEKRSARVLLVGLGCFLMIANGGQFGRFAIFTYAFSALVLIYSPYIVFPKLFLRMLRYLGELSYPLYLFHFPTIFFSYAILKISNSAAFASLSLVTSGCFYYIIDVQIRHKRKLTQLAVKI